MKNPSAELLALKKKVTETLLENGFALESFNIEVEEDANHVGHLRVRILPNTLKDEEDLKIDSKFNDIIEGLD